MIRNIITASLTILSLCLLVILLNITTPLTAGPFGILIIFIFAYIAILGVMTYLVFFTSRLILKISIIFISSKPYQPLTLRASYYYSTVLAAIPILIIGLQSVGSMGLYETGLIILFTLIGMLYVSRRVN